MAMVAVDMPHLGLVTASARVLRWLKAEGEVLTQGEPLLEVETEKAAVEIAAPVSGRLSRILAPVGETVDAGAALAWVETEAPAAPAANRSGRPAQPPATAVAWPLAASAGQTRVAGRPRLLASPAARRLATQFGLDLAAVPGTGPGGRIALRDVTAALAAATAPASGPPTSPEATAAAPQPGRRRALTPLRRAVARAMTLSATSIPQFSVGRQVDWSEVLRYRQQVAPSDQTPETPALSLNDFLLQAITRILLTHPDMNAIFVGDPTGLGAHIRQAVGVHIGLVVAVPGGIVVPVLHHLEGLSLFAIARRRQDAVARARTGRLRQDEVSGATFSLSNLGAGGPDRFTALLNPPESGILTVGRCRQVPVVHAGAVAIRPVSDLTLTVDHRLADGKAAADFLQSLAGALEGGEWLLR